jgi:hypothetical protein
MEPEDLTYQRFGGDDYHMCLFVRARLKHVSTFLFANNVNIESSAKLCVGGNISKYVSGHKKRNL